MPGRKIKDEADAKACMQAASRSGVSHTAWARRHGVDARSLNAWRMNLARRAARVRGELQLVELVPHRASTPRPLVLRCGAWCLEVHQDTDLDLLAHVLEVVESC